MGRGGERSSPSAATGPSTPSTQGGDAPRIKRQKLAPAGPGPSADLQARQRQLLEERRQLPVWSAKQRLLELVVKHRTLIVVGETGSGKTTQIPQFILQSGMAKGGMIACTQPRRVAATTVARRVAEEMGVRLGQEVGYSVRFDDTTSAATRIKYMTDGMLLREALLDPLLSKYKVVLVDEAHERTVHTDVLLGVLKDVQRRRDALAAAGTGAAGAAAAAAAAADSQAPAAAAAEAGGGRRPGPPAGVLRLIIMSATLVASEFQRYFEGSVAAYVQGRQYPVQVMYTAEPQDSYTDAALNAVLQIHSEEGAGDILVFLTGQDEIDSLQRLLEERADLLPAGPSGLRLLVAPIYAALPPEQQMQVFEPPPAGFRKAILATNIAEASITIRGVRFVVDTGMVKARAHDARRGADLLQVQPISQSQARQRSGRAGRESAGRCYRLYTEASFMQLLPAAVPEILRSSLASVVLQLKALGIQDVLGFDFMDAPPRPAVIRSLELLLGLGALDSRGFLTEAVGRPMSRLPVDPMFGKVLLASAALGCSTEAMQVVAMASSDSVFVTPRNKREDAQGVHKRFAHKDGDHPTLLGVLRMFLATPRAEQGAWCSENFLNIRALRKALDIYAQLSRHLDQLAIPRTSCGEDLAPLRRALTAGLFPHAARRQPDNTYRVIAGGQVVTLHPSSTLAGRKPEVVVFDELVETTKRYARNVCAIDAAWLPAVAPAYFQRAVTAAAPVLGGAVQSGRLGAAGGGVGEVATLGR